jgi:prevent-host-death family protein
MKLANIADLKNNLSKFLTMVQDGEIIAICKRNIPIAHLIPISNNPQTNNTKLGCGLGSVEIIEDLTQPMIPTEDWNMLKDEDPT